MGLPAGWLLGAIYTLGLLGSSTYTRILPESMQQSVVASVCRLLWVL